MVSRLVPSSLLGAIAGAALFVAASSSPSPAFTLFSPSLVQPTLSAEIQDAYWCRWGRCGGWGWHRWGYWHRPWGWHRWGWGWHRHWGWHRWG